MSRGDYSNITISNKGNRIVRHLITPLTPHESEVEQSDAKYYLQFHDVTYDGKTQQERSRASIIEKALTKYRKKLPKIEVSFDLMRVLGK